MREVDPPPTAGQSYWKNVLLLSLPQVMGEIITSSME
jgi:hypothetical protein